ncbi:NAD(P)-dependent oxidoreductase [Pseudactinotalea sp. HY158]|uniref:NAD(P)-dependent oxidoreductase n=1 Tax=Pseudactinotalea sp. HY158 TaxID=2654547 RepID=UPI00129C4245|nr:NAD(P)-dependent oxidoreductase [Pseudactinotalea sp. HY158]QGH69134.1 NAD-binding protein [Pseudactinotalea sp. HY158]
MSTDQRIGFIGLGAMGSPMAVHIARAQAATGRALHVHARRHASAEESLAAGAEWAPTPADLARVSDVVLTVLPDLPELEQVLDGETGLLAGTDHPLALVACSTSSPAGVRDLGARLAERTGGLVSLVDAPISGGVEGAREGSLSIFVGGDHDPAQAAAAALAPCGSAVHLGPLGSGQVAKAANQLIVAATTAALAEALVAAERAGLDLAALVPILAGGYAGSRLLEVKGQRFVDHDHSPASPASFMIKDLRYAHEVARASGIPSPVLDAAAGVYDAMVAAGLGDLDSSGVQAYLERA